MTARPRIAIVIASVLLAACVLAACDDMNRPAYVPKSEVRKQCFSDVECPGGKCAKSGGDIQGVCVGPEPDGGAPSEAGADGGPSPAPSVQPQPGDIQI